MGSIEAAIRRVFLAETTQEIETILAEEPQLFSPAADDVLASLQAHAEEQGDADLVAALAQLRELLKSVLVASDIELPDMPGASSAADLIHALIAVAPDAPVPSAALTDVFFAVLDTLRDHASRNELAPMLENLRLLDQRIAAAGGREGIAGHGRESIFSMIEEWVDAPTWIDSHGFLVEHGELLSSDARAIVSLLARGARKREAAEDAAILDQHANILVAAQAGQLEEAYIDLIERERAGAGPREGVEP